MTNQEDFAVVIGISRYPQLTNLAAAVNDAKELTSWLTDPLGGGLPSENVQLLISDELRAQEERSQHPNRHDVDHAFEKLVRLSLRDDQRIGRRLYIYMAGHGYATTPDDVDDVALLMADASQDFPSAVAAKSYADSFRQSRTFDEIVLFVDCDRTILRDVAPLPPPWPTRVPAPLSQKASFFYAYAIARDNHAYEALANGAERPHGLFTSAILQGLRGSAAGPDGTVSSQTLQAYLSRPLGHAIAQEQLPQVISGGPTPIIFVNISQQGQPGSAATTTQTLTPESILVPFDLGKYQLSTGATTILHSASSSAAEGDAPMSTSFVLLEIAGQGRPGREREWAADFLLDAISTQTGKFQEVMAKFRGGKQGSSPGQQESSSRPEARMMKPGLAWSLNRAQEIATETTSEATVCGRHLLAALIVDVPQPYTIGAQRLLAALGVDIPLLRQRMYEWVRGYGDDDTRWRAVLIGTGTEPRRKVEFTADTTTGLDLIGIEQDVLALATLIAARDSSPPLSIGLFGDWGSGKTFFMGQLRSAVAQFSKEVREASVMQRDLPFYKHIVQIDFNAWHYVEGNLWASMVDHILGNLRVSDDQRLTVTEELQQHWIAKLGFTQRAKEEADKKNTEAAARVSQAETAVHTAENTHEEKKRQLQTLSRKSAGRDFKLSGAVQVITDSLEPLGLKPVSDAVADLQSSIRQARSAVEGGNAVLSPLIYAKDKKDRWRSLLIILLAAPFVAAVIGSVLNRLGHAQIAQISAWATGAAGLLTGGARWVRKQTEWVSEQSKKVENAQRTFDEALAKELASTADQIAKTEQELAIALQDYMLAKQRAEQARREQEEALSDLAAATTARLLGQFIQDRAASTDYRKHLGVLALVRQDFQKLSSLIEEDNWRLAPPGPDDQRFVGRQLRKITSLEEENADAATRISRIVLYIDDLDRCPPAKVVEVLQAVHLLLAFPLFVVVVGVDARWISRSLESRYRELLHFGQADAAVDLTEMFGFARSEDYLEKIFQIPLWLRRMDAGTAQRMVQGLLGKRIQPPSKKSEDSGMTDGPKPAAPSPSQNVGQLNQGAGVEQQASVPTPAAPSAKVEHSAGILAAPAPTPTSTAPAKPIVPNLQSLEIRDFEISAIDGLSSLLARSPRALKRFVNLYRLIKAGLTPAEHDDFVRESQDALGGFQAVLFLLAIDTGLPRVSRLVFDALLEMKETGDLGVKQLLERVDQHPSANTADWNTLKDWIGALEGPGKFDRGMAVIAKWAPQVARYSFQASHIEGTREFPERV
jgi:hypothetical protein